VLQERGWRQQQLARATGLSTPTISRLITGSRPTASIATLRTLAAVLGVPLDELVVSETGEPLDVCEPEPEAVPAPPPGPPTPQQRIAVFFAEHPELAVRFALLAGREPEYIAELLEGMIRAEDARTTLHAPPDQPTDQEGTAG
jgi:transcriptional regulator with XRE-family HTH domain